MNSQRPFSQACDNNRDPILAVLKQVLPANARVLEIGSGTGQHAVYFAEHLAPISWQPSDVADNLPGINAWLEDCKGPAPLAPLQLDVLDGRWPTQHYDAVFSANTAHIMAWETVLTMLDGISQVINRDGLFVLYGPFNYHGRYTSDSNARFDQWLRQIAPHQGIRDIEALTEAASRRKLLLVEDHAMPANNRCLVFRYQPDAEPAGETRSH